MLESTRRRGATIVVYVIFGLLTAVMVFSFGPQSFGGTQGCSGPSQGTVLTLDDEEYGMNSWRWAFNPQRGSYPGRVVGGLDGLVRRELLAQEAERRGLRVPEQVIDDHIMRGEIWLLTQPIPGKDIYFDEGAYFDYKLLERWIGQYGMSIGAFKAEQRREILAAAMAEILGSAAHATRDEAFARWLHEQRTVTADAVAFPVARYRDQMKLSDADVDRYLAAHEAEVKAKYEADKATAYTATPARVRLRRVFVVKADAAAPPEAPADPGKAKLEAARAEIVSKKKTLADVARALDSDEAVRARGGDLGWVLPDAPGLGDPALGEALKPLTPGGEPSAVIETAGGYWLLAVDDRREGDLSFDQVKREIATTLATDAWAREAAKRAALDALAQARAGTGKNLADLFEKEPDAPQPMPLTPEQLQEIRELIDNPETDPALREQLQQLLQQQGLGAVWESTNIPASWSARGQAGDPAAPAAAPSSPPDDLMTPSTEALPAFGEIEKPKVQRVGPLRREVDRVGQLGQSKELMTALFDQLGEGAIADRIYEVKGPTGPAFVVIQVVTKPTIDPSAFDVIADDYVRQLEEERRGEIVDQWVRTRCQDLVTRGAISASNDVLTTRDEKNNLVAIPWTACSR